MIMIMIRATRAITSLTFCGSKYKRQQWLHRREKTHQLTSWLTVLIVPPETSRRLILRNFPHPATLTWLSLTRIFILPQQETLLRQ